MGNADLEMLLAADEEARARIDAASEAAQAAVAGARRARARSDAEQVDRLRRQLDDELEAIRAESERAVLERRRHRTAFLEHRRRDTEAWLPQAAETYARIVRDGPPVAGSTTERAAPSRGARGRSARPRGGA